MLVSSLGKGLYTIGLTVWVVFAILLGQSLAALLLNNLPIRLNVAVATTILAALGYMFALALVIGVPALATRKFPSKTTLGIDRLPSWSDIGLGILAVLPYYLLSAFMLWLGTTVFSVIDSHVGQQVAFSNLNLKIEYLVAFITLVAIAPFAEELLFRGYFLGKLSKHVSKWLAVVVTAVAFGLLHLFGFTDSGVVLQWAASVDTFALAITAGTLRLLSGSIWAGVLLHATKNAIAFYFLFINPPM